MMPVVSVTRLDVLTIAPDADHARSCAGRSPSQSRDDFRCSVPRTSAGSNLPSLIVQQKDLSIGFFGLGRRRRDLLVGIPFILKFGHRHLLGGLSLRRASVQWHTQSDSRSGARRVSECRLHPVREDTSA
jgi:hypothetical protein